MADLEERVAALEAALSVPPLPPMTEEQVAEFKEKWAAAVEHHEVKWLPHDPSLALLAADGSPVTTPCLSRCLPACDHGTACHERRYPPYWRDHDPDDCERRRAALDEHSRLSAGLEA